MTAKEVSTHIKAAGFHSKADFARLMGLSLNTVNLWGAKSPIPPYFFQVLEWAKKAKKYDDLIKDLQK